jgi:hypothetical protein
MTSLEQIATWLASGKSTTLEFKKSSAEKERACRTLCVFANVPMESRLALKAKPLTTAPEAIIREPA